MLQLAEWQNPHLRLAVTNVVSHHESPLRLERHLRAADDSCALRLAWCLHTLPGERPTEPTCQGREPSDAAPARRLDAQRSYDPTQRVAHISGSLTEGGQPVQPIRNDPYGFQGVLWHGTALGGSFPGIVNATAGPLSLDDSGHFSETVPIAQTTYFRASGGTVLGHFGRAACKPPTIAPKGCVSATRSGFARGSLIIEVTVLEGRDRSSESGPGFSPEKLSRGRITPPCGWCAVNASMTGAGMPGIIVA